MRAMRRLSGILVLYAVFLPAGSAAQIVNTLRGFEDQKMSWSGGLEGTVAAAEGNTDYLEYELAAAAQHMSERNRWRLLGRWMDRRSRGERVAKSRLLHLRHNWRFTPEVASVAFVQATHNPDQRLETRLLIGAGARFDLIATREWKGAIGVATMYEDEEIAPLPEGAGGTVPDDSGFEREHRASVFLSLYSTATAVQTDLVAFWQPRWTDPSDARSFVAASFRVDVTGGLYFLFRYDLTWDTDPPATVGERDQGLRGGLGLEF